MDIGNLFILMALGLSLFSGWNYYAAIKITGSRKSKRQQKRNQKPQKINRARRGFYLMAFMTGLASIYLLYLILNHQFQFSYVYRYTSNDLPLGYLISAFWAGQEGSFLLWTLLTAVMGMVLIKTAREFESWAMLIVNTVQVFFFSILLKASPFATTAHMPPDGAGLNPLLQNPWMVIHPPILFLGYAAITFPFAMAIAALARRDYPQFVHKALPWTLFSSLTLGAGIIIGGYWAYTVLGWGGYWGWDPVENSSLVPWLIIIALLHGLVVQRVKGSLVRTNFFLTILSLALVLYATFLTRSGVLADFSVHSFQDHGINFYLIAFILVTLAAGMGLFLKRYREMSAAAVDFSSLNRENILFGGLIVIAVSAFMVFVGTSSPIITGLLGNPSQVGAAFYNNVHLPIAVLIGLLLGVAPFLRWKEEGITEILKSVLLSLVLTALVVAILVVVGLVEPLHIVFAAAALLAFWSNTLAGLRLLRFGWQSIGAPVTHMGVALLLLGIITSASLEQKQKVLLEQGRPQKVFNYEMLYQGTAAVPNGKDILNITVRDGNGEYLAEPRFYYSRYNKAMMGEPDVRSAFLYDVYISPLEKKEAAGQPGDSQVLLIKKGETRQLGDYQVHFSGFDMGNHSQEGTMRVGAILEITRGEKRYTAVPAVVVANNQRHSEPAVVRVSDSASEPEASVALYRIDATTGSVELLFNGLNGGKESASPASAEQILVEVSKKPFMNVLWLGAILILGGTLIAIPRRLARVEASAVLQKKPPIVNKEPLLEK